MQAIKKYNLTIKKSKTVFQERQIKGCTDAVSLVRSFFSKDIFIYESGFIVLLNASGVTLGYAKISQGGVTETVIDPKIVAKYAIDSLAASVIICHNHPSGNPTPSRADKYITKKIKDGLDFLDIKLLDHIILTGDAYYSFADEGLL